ncbi:MAG TPA: bifunctional diaminohydroxyphosphoribosylaminopyrimidine deaminase/5-amino-6-(5-phosphoribosylamino)uracil reductase RibD [Candidatus Polarisedimenticolaceae bacterium]
MSLLTSDAAGMEQALALAALGRGTTSPNPSVGCVVVRDGEVVGRGFHARAGGPHAEALAVAQAGERARGATVYVNLEPCAHQGRTPPCAELLVAAGVRRVVAAIVDPNPLVDGRGLARLRAAGIEVVCGTLADAAEELNAAFLLRQRLGRPLVTLKAAVTVDGRIAAKGGRAAWISSPESRRYAHRLRVLHDAIVVGAGTVRADDPRLTVRLPGVAAPRLRGVLAPRGGLDPAARLFAADGAAPPPRVYVLDSHVESARAELGPRAVVVPMGPALDLRAVLADLAAAGALSVLVEGGGRTHAAFLEAGLADRAVLFVATSLLGVGGTTPLADIDGAVDPASGFRLRDVERFPIGADLVLRGRCSRD